MALTLFKAVEREDVESQYERVQRDGYYKNLRIMGIDEKVIQPAPAKARRTRRTTPSVKSPVKPPKAEQAAPKAKAKAKPAATIKPKRKTATKSTGRAQASKHKPVKAAAKAKKKVAGKKKTTAKRTGKKKAK